MQIIAGRTIYSASDLNNYLECVHLSELSREVARGELRKPERAASLELIARKGLEHEQTYLEYERSLPGAEVVVLEPRSEHSLEALQADADDSLAAMARGAQLIYQATFFDETFMGRADFLRRVETPSRAWAWSYEVIDTKLALSSKSYFLLQLCNYSEHLERLQGTAPVWGHIVLGNREQDSFRMNEFAAYYRHVKASFLANIDGLHDTYPEERPHCAICAWDARCEAQREHDDHLGLVAFMRREQIEKFRDAGIATLGQLAVAGDDQKPWGMAESTFTYLREQARQQHGYRQTRSHSYAYRASEPNNGLANLPEPATGDVFFDIEGDPLYRPARGLEYLFGLYLSDEDAYLPFWATDLSEERKAFEQVVDYIVERRRKHPDLRVYHYAPYETTALKRLMGDYASREDAIDDLLRNEVFIDLYPIARQSLWISQPSYSLKKFEAFYAMQRLTDTRRGDDSIVNFEEWLLSQDPKILDDIRAYNEDDCRSTHLLRDWLVERRAELNATLAEPLPWRTFEAKVAPEREPDATERERVLLDGLPAPDSLAALRDWAEPLRARWLLGSLLEYYRRESKPEWWKYFERTRNVDQLEEYDHVAIGGLRLRPDVAPYKLGQRDRNLVYTYAMPPQDHNLSGSVSCPDERTSAGSIVAIDEAAGTLAIKLAGKIAPDKLRALIPSEPIDTRMKRAAIERIADLVIAGTLATERPATSDLLLARAPRLGVRGASGDVQPDVVSKESVSAAVASLERSALFIQGPPGSGKSTIGANTIVDLLAAGKSVGLAAHSHKALHNLLAKIESTAAERGVVFTGVHKLSDENEGSEYVSSAQPIRVNNTASAPDFENSAYQLVSGTSYAWSNAKLQRVFDFIFIDEAGQVPLADALVVSMRAHNVVLLGDPLQLPHVSQGTHPVGVKLSILEHVLGDAATVPTSRGIFLDKTYRMHPAIARFVSDTIYEGRLESAPGAHGNHVESSGLSGSGLRYLPIAHTSNSKHSVEEAERIVAEVRLLLEGSVANNGEATRPMRPRDILVVTPYNLQRQKIEAAFREAGIDGIRVGTVDKFQGQEAAVVFYSMATSSDQDMPRDKEFLFDRNRFNVAISRAQALSVVVCSPALLDTRCTKPTQMSLVNLLCAFVESAQSVGAADTLAGSLP
jgi:predicted RecB family nuclease